MELDSDHARAMAGIDFPQRISDLDRPALKLPGSDQALTTRQVEDVTNDETMTAC
jgi:hypothetical protein